MNMKPKKYTFSQVLRTLQVVVGFLLSPLSWWNDLFINIPLAYAFSIPFSFLHYSLFLPAFIVGYLLTNIIGLLMLHHGIKNLLRSTPKISLKKHLLISLLYTLMIIVAVISGLIIIPTNYFS